MTLKPQNLLITGIGGFIGLRAAEKALAQGMKVRGLQRSPEKAQIAQQLGADMVIGSITDSRAAQRACQGMDLVLHTAATVKEGGTSHEFRSINVDGTVTLAKAARDAGVKTFIHLSSVMVYGFNYPDRVTEDGPFRGENNPYCQSKIESEQALLRFNHPPDFGVIIIRPGDVYGPRSLSWVIRPLQLMRKKAFIMADGGQGVMNHVYIDNLIDAIFLAIVAKNYGEAFNITDGHTTSFKDYFTELANMANLPQPFSLPAGVLKGLLRMRCLSQSLRGHTPDMLPVSVDFINRPYAYSIEKAQNLLRYRPAIDLEAGMQLTRAWLQSVKF